MGDYKKIGVLAGKGGVGKSTISAALARTLANRGFKVLFFDADVTGSNALNIFGQGSGVKLEHEKFLPSQVSSNLWTMGMQYIRTYPLFWRGKSISEAAFQLLDLTDKTGMDFIIIDMAPGCGPDVQAVLKKIGLDGAVLITIGSNLMEEKVKSTVRMLRETQTPIVGEIRNFTSLKCECGREHKIFDYDFNLPFQLLGKLPIYKGGVNAVSHLSLGDEVYKNFMQGLKHPVKLERISLGKKAKRLTTKLFMGALNHAWKVKQEAEKDGKV